MLNRLNVLSDGILVLGSYLFAAWLWLHVIVNTEGNMAAVDNLNGRALLVAVIYAAWTTMVLGCLKVYRTTRVHHAGREG